MKIRITEPCIIEASSGEAGHCSPGDIADVSNVIGADMVAMGRAVVAADEAVPGDVAEDESEPKKRGRPRKVADGD